MRSIKSGEKQFVKRVFPRYPFSFLVFKAKERAFEVRDVSFRGMQISLKDGVHGLSPGDGLNGELHWKGEVLEVVFRVKWADKERVGGAFEWDEGFEGKVRDFFCVENILKGLRPLHRQEAERGLPPRLKYWFKSDGSVEFFVWCRKDGRISSFQGIVLNRFFEWEEGGEGLDGEDPRAQGCGHPSGLLGGIFLRGGCQAQRIRGGIGPGGFHGASQGLPFRGGSQVPSLPFELRG